MVWFLVRIWLLVQIFDRLYSCLALSKNVDGLCLTGVNLPGSLGKTVLSCISSLVSLNYRQHLRSYWRWLNCQRPCGVLPIGDRRRWCWLCREGRWNTCQSEIFSVDVKLSGRPTRFLSVGNRRFWYLFVGTTNEVLADRRSLMLMLTMLARPMEFHWWWSDDC